MYGYPGGYYGDSGIGWFWIIIIVLIVFFILFWNNGNNNNQCHKCNNR